MADLQRENAMLKHVMDHVSNELYNIYNGTCDSAKPEFYAAVLGCHEILESAVQGEFLIPMPKELQRREP